MAPLQAPFHADTGALVQLYGLDSVLHSAWRKQLGARRKLEASIRALAARIDQVSGSSEAHHFGILATHILFITRIGLGLNGYGNDARWLGNWTMVHREGLRPLVHLV